MANLTAAQAGQLADYFHQLAQFTGDYIQANKEGLTDDKRNALYDLQFKLLKHSGEINAQAATLVVEEAEQSLEAMDAITAEVKATLKKLADIQKVINIATSLVNLGTAILSKDPRAIGQELIDMGKQLGIKVRNPLDK